MGNDPAGCEEVEIGGALADAGAVACVGVGDDPDGAESLRDGAEHVADLAGPRAVGSDVLDDQHGRFGCCCD